MNFDFALILVLATFVTGVLWLLDMLVFVPRRRLRLAEAELKAGGALPEEARKQLIQPSGWADLSRSMFPVLGLVLLLRSFLYEPFQIPSGSMLPTLQVGDYILVNKYHYGLRLPVLNTKFLPLDEPQRGDVVVFKYPEQPSINYIKRVVGLPGDVVTYSDKVVYINGEAQSQSLLAQLPPLSPERLLVKETLGEAEHEIYRDIGRPTLNAQWTVPAGHYFVMGDNRDNSNDSRYWGFVPDELLVGKAVAVWMHWSELLSLPDFGAVRSIK
ncbi:signal peptidase I [Marinobacterium zhoushanense]|uniref:Signal peptidase I n=1 Tax=Marinobacterium zhoushanense TaxID=1679163 RepID=A0ABQ1K6F6_9GAMM|nr:signal peptidase I [Marinobacterium zhoushanense]GGB89085.1 signal peptidase I [Marinobacterium zhoushanense]